MFIFPTKSWTLIRNLNFLSSFNNKHLFSTELNYNDASYRFQKKLEQQTVYLER